MLGLQLYFLYVTYQGEKELLIKDLRTSVELVTEEVLDDREDQIHDYYKGIIQDSTLIKVVWNWDDVDEPMFSLQDANTGEKVLSFTYGERQRGDSSMMKEVMDKFLNQDLGPKSHVYFGLTDELDARIETFRDTVGLNLELYGRLLDERLAGFGIEMEYEFQYLDSTITAEELGYTFYANMPKAIEKGLRQPTVIVAKPFFDILKRMYLILMASIIVVFLIALSFASLVRTVNRQRKLSSLKDDFIDSMTHELLTPIATLKISLETLENQQVRNDDERAAKYLNISKMELSRVSDIVHNVLYSSLHDQKEAKLKVERINVNEVLDDLVSYHGNINADGLDISYQPLEDPWVNTDKQHFTNVLHNLIDNGVKYANGKANITIVPTRYAGELSIVVNDNGCGIPESEQPKVFDKFYRSKAVQDIKGLGVGLYYVKTILTRLRGDVELLHSSPKGSSFKISLNTSNQ